MEKVNLIDLVQNNDIGSFKTSLFKKMFLLRLLYKQNCNLSILIKVYAIEEVKMIAKGYFNKWQKS